MWCTYIVKVYQGINPSQTLLVFMQKFYYISFL